MHLILTTGLGTVYVVYWGLLLGLFFKSQMINCVFFVVELPRVGRPIGARRKFVARSRQVAGPSSSAGRRVEPRPALSGEWRCVV